MRAQSRSGVLGHVHEAGAAGQHDEAAGEADALALLAGRRRRAPGRRWRGRSRRAAGRRGARPSRSSRRSGSSAAVAGRGVTRIVRPRHSNGSPVHACRITSTYSSRSFPRSRAVDAGHLELLVAVAEAGDEAERGRRSARSTTASCSARRTGSCSGSSRAAMLIIDRASCARRSPPPASTGAGR